MSDVIVGFVFILLSILTYGFIQGLDKLKDQK